MDEKKQKEIKDQAKKILDNFAKTLDKVKIERKEQKKKAGGFREEGNGEKPDNDFKKRMFENSPCKDGDYLIAEKKKW